MRETSNNKNSILLTIRNLYSETGTLPVLDIHVR